MGTPGDLINLHIDDAHEVGKPPHRSKAAVMEALKSSLGGVKIVDLSGERGSSSSKTAVQSKPHYVVIDLSSSVPFFLTRPLCTGLRSRQRMLALRALR
jgi:hypothetical protein